MTYAQYGLIQASDFNNLAGGSAANVSGQINCVLGTGYRDVGYGQSTVGNVAQYNKVYATDWASMINKLNSVRQHQTGSGTGISAPSTGNLIQYISTLTSSITSAYNNRLTYASSGTTSTGSNFNDSFTAAGNALGTKSIVRTITFGSSDQARYFFNGGGQLKLVASATNNNGNDRSSSMVSLIGTNFVSDTLYAVSNSGRSGSGGSVAFQSTAYGYYSVGSYPSFVIACTLNPSGYYSSDKLDFSAATGGTAGSNGGRGEVVYLQLALRSQIDTSPLDVTVTTRVDITPPETTYLSNTWGTITVS